MAVTEAVEPPSKCLGYPDLQVIFFARVARKEEPTADRKTRPEWSHEPRIVSVPLKRRTLKRSMTCQILKSVFVWRGYAVSLRKYGSATANTSLAGSRAQGADSFFNVSVSRTCFAVSWLPVPSSAWRRRRDLCDTNARMFWVSE